MNNFPNRFALRRCLLFICVIFLLIMAGQWHSSVNTSANHPVLVEGEQDFDGDGRLGAAEDTDSPTDQVFGTIGAALKAANSGVNQNGRVLIVTSGRFLETVTINGVNGNVQLEAAPGVDANIDSVRSGDTNNTQRQMMPGIVVNSPNTRIITIRNIVSRNWTDGIVVMGNSRVVLEHCRFDNNVNYGVHVMDNSRVAISNCSITGSGFRASSDADNTPNPGVGISFQNSSSGTIAFTTVAGSIKAGIQNATNNKKALGILSVNIFDNSPDFEGLKPPKGSVPTSVSSAQ